MLRKTAFVPGPPPGVGEPWHTHWRVNSAAHPGSEPNFLAERQPVLLAACELPSLVLLCEPLDHRRQRRRIPRHDYGAAWFGIAGGSSDRRRGRHHSLSGSSCAAAPKMFSALIVLVLVAAIALGAKPGSARNLTLAGIVWHNEMTNNAAA